MLWSLASIIFAFILIWFTSDSVVRNVTRLAKRIQLSSFAISFVLLGIITSAPEFSIGINAIIDGIPQIFVGNLLGGIIVLFLLVCPFLAVMGNGIKVSHSVTPRSLFIILVLTGLPGIIALRGYIDYIGAITMMILYIVLIFFMRSKRGLFHHIRALLRPKNQKANFHDILKILAALVIIFFSGRLLVENLEIIANYLNTPPFILSLLALSVGSNLPELFIGTLAVIRKQKEVAFGHYLGAAASNGFFLGLLTLINGPLTITDPYFFIIPLYIVVGLTLFYFFVQKRNDISRNEGYVLLMLYLSFVFVKIFIH